MGLQSCDHDFDKGDADGSMALPQARKAACSDLLGSDMTEHELWENFGNIDPPVCTCWPCAAHWHYEALRTWADLMVRACGEDKLADAKAGVSV